MVPMLGGQPDRASSPLPIDAVHQRHEVARLRIRTGWGIKQRPLGHTFGLDTREHDPGLLVGVAAPVESLGNPLRPLHQDARVRGRFGERDRHGRVVLRLNALQDGLSILPG